MPVEYRGTVSVWEGEWPLLKKWVAETREVLVAVALFFGSFINIGAYRDTARSYTTAADTYITEKTHTASTQLRDRRWILPATGITAVSLFVVSKSAPWGTYAALRNGTLTGVGLVCFLFPREVMDAVSAKIPPYV